MADQIVTVTQDAEKLRLKAKVDGSVNIVRITRDACFSLITNGPLRAPNVCSEGFITKSIRKNEEIKSTGGEEAVRIDRTGAEQKAVSYVTASKIDASAGKIKNSGQAPAIKVNEN